MMAQTPAHSMASHQTSEKKLRCPGEGGFGAKPRATTQPTHGRRAKAGAAAAAGGLPLNPSQDIICGARRRLGGARPPRRNTRGGLARTRATTEGAHKTPPNSFTQATQGYSHAQVACSPAPHLP